MYQGSNTPQMRRAMTGMSDAAWQRHRSTSRMIASVANGRGQMPAFKKKLSRQEIAASVAYVRTLRR